MISIIEEANETILDFYKGMLKYSIFFLFFLFCFVIPIKTEYNTFKVKLSNLQLNKLKLGVKNWPEITL